MPAVPAEPLAARAWPEWVAARTWVWVVVRALPEQQMPGLRLLAAVAQMPAVRTGSLPARRSCA